MTHRPSNHIDAHPDPAITVRYHPGFPEVTLFAGGWRVGQYKTANGLRNAIAKYTSDEFIANWAATCIAHMDAKMRDDVLSGRRVIGASPRERAAIRNALDAVLAA